MPVMVAPHTSLGLITGAGCSICAGLHLASMVFYRNRRLPARTRHLALFFLSGTATPYAATASFVLLGLLLGDAYKPMSTQTAA